jgi:hypothetical protein
MLPTTYSLAYAVVACLVGWQGEEAALCARSAVLIFEVALLQGCILFICTL